MKSKNNMNPLLTQQMLNVMEKTIENITNDKKATEVNTMLNDFLNDFLKSVLKSVTGDILTTIKKCIFIFDEFIKYVIETDENTKYNICEINKRHIIIECDDVYNKNVSFKEVPVKKFEEFLSIINLDSDGLDNIDESEVTEILLIHTIISKLSSELNNK